jgi:hypothetical protein
VPYTVWSNDRLVGESDLDYLTNTSELKLGDFTATEDGEAIIAILMAPRQAVCSRAPYDEIESLCTQRESVPLELRGPNGRVIPTDDIEITDLEWLLSLTPVDWRDDDWQPDVDMPELQADLEALAELDLDEFDVPDIELDPPGAQPSYPRYQIQVRIKGGG